MGEAQFCGCATMDLMSTWIIGDIHGCFDTLMRLLRRIDFDPRADRIIQVGDLANKGPKTLEVIRWAKGLGDRFQMVLGNHDLHLLARAEGRRTRKEDTLQRVLKAPDREELLTWLGGQPLILRFGSVVVVHAGFVPSWSLNEAESLARAGEEAIREGRIGELHERRKSVWSPDLEGVDRTASGLAVLTRIRTVRSDQTPFLDFWGPREMAPQGAKGWFEESKIIAAGNRVVFGHWATLGLFRFPGAICLDSGCVYGGTLSAMRLEDDCIVQVPSENSEKGE